MDVGVVVYNYLVVTPYLTFERLGARSSWGKYILVGILAYVYLAFLRPYLRSAKEGLAIE